MIIKGCTLVSEGKITENCNIRINGDKIEEVFHGEVSFEAEVVDVKGDYVIPGFIDLQLNGAAGTVFKFDLNEYSLKKTFETHLKYGTTSWLPTMVSASHADIIKSIEVVKEFQGRYGILGMHLEASYFNIKKRGAHQSEFIRKPNDEELLEIVKKGAGVIKFMTIAPEMFTDKQINLLTDSGIKLSAGHSNASYTQSQHAFNMGVSKVTHLYNAMSSFTSREPGLTGAVLDNENIYAGIIVDGVHSHYSSVRIAVKLKKDKLILVSDSSFLEHPEKEFFIYGMKVIQNGGYCISVDGTLAGSNIAMYHGFYNMVNHVGIPKERAVDMASLVPAKYLGIDGFYGKIEKGSFADFVILNKDLQIKGVINKGEFTQHCF